LCSPPYSFYRQRQADMLALVAALIEAAPAGSILVVEAEQTFDPALLPRADQWDVRRYAPAIVAIYRALR
jgi:16S rRNA (guanine966-N2)-methyltransferase